MKIQREREIWKKQSMSSSKNEKWHLIQFNVFNIHIMIIAYTVTLLHSFDENTWDSLFVLTGLVSQTGSRTSSDQQHDDSGLLLNWATKCHFCGLLRFLWCIEFFSFNQQLFITSYVLWTVNKIIQSSSLDLARSTSRDAVSTRLPNSKDRKGPKRLRKWRCNLCLLSPCSPWLAWSYLHSQQSRMSPQEIWEQRGRLRTSPPTGSPPGCLVVDVSTHPVDDVG